MLRYTRDEGGALTPLFLMLMVGAIAGMLLFLQVGHGSVLATESRTAADAAALGGAREFRDQLAQRFVALAYHDLRDNVGLPQLLEGFGPVQRERICAAAGDYAKRNGSEVTRCDVDPWALTVTVSVRGDEGPVGGPSSGISAMRPEFRSKAEIDLASILNPGGGGGGGAAGSGLRIEDLTTDFQPAGSHLDDRRGTNLREVAADQPEVILEILIREASFIHAQRIGYDYGGGHVDGSKVDKYPPCCQPGAGVGGPLASGNGWDCSSSVSALLQTVFPHFHTRVSGSFMSVGQAGYSSRFTIWANDGHVWTEIGRDGWGTSRSNAFGGPGWAHHAGQGASGRTTAARHIGFLEDIHPSTVHDLMQRYGPGSLGGPPGFPGALPDFATPRFPIKLVPLDA